MERTDDPPLTVLLELYVRRGHEREFEAAMRRFLDVAVQQPGHLGTSTIRPLAEGDPHRFIYKFDRRSNFRCWRESDQRQDLLAEAMKYVTRVEESDEVGLASWLTLPGTPPLNPPKWKTTFVTWLAVYPVVMLYSYGLDAVGFEAHPLVRGLVLTAIAVPTAAYISAPWFAKILMSWLKATPKRSSE
jgi:antibiotic biosynthesis monooxygenase (ABM) superfamily enzyme